MLNKFLSSIYKMSYGDFLIKEIKKLENHTVGCKDNLYILIIKINLYKLLDTVVYSDFSNGYKPF